MARAQTIQIYLPSGSPAGIRVASITTRTVRVFEVPRSLLSEFLQRRESGQVGVYFLFGAAGEESTRAYIGQSGNVGERLKQHTSGKDFWTTAMVAVSLTNEWTSTHVAFLEWLSIDRAIKAGRYALLNGNQASNPHTPEPMEADCYEFLDTIAVLLATLGAPVLEPVRQSPTTVSSADTAGPVQELLFFREAGCEATGYQTSEGMLVLAGSVGRADLRGSAVLSTRRLRDLLREQGVVDLQEGRLVFVKDHLFNSPSAAGGFLVGGSNNGRTSWKNDSGQDLNHIEARELTAFAGGGALSADVEGVMS
ncbi:GIY-YIG nuclease family protein [Rhodococcus sp. NPDC127528]|uniref:GIY-YIG nuclease family protein n=1 Tax=unclassified Rhodococcus (in: high G+C Gram-positive bacteria) TaxID=192944 RepID=UPI00363E15EB